MRQRKNPTMPSPRTFSLKYPDWFEKRQDVRRKLDRINNDIWESEKEQAAFLCTVFGAVGEDPYFLEPVSFVNGKNIFIGDNVIIGSNSVVSKDIPSNTVAFGCSARPHRAIEDDTNDALCV